MRYQMSGFAFLFAVVGCGGNGDGGKVMVMADAKSVMDAPADAAKVCSVMSSLGALSLGAMTAVTNDFFIGPDANTNNKVIFLLAAGLPGSMQGNADVLAVEVVKPQAGFLPNMTYNFDPNPTNAMYAAQSYILEDFTGMAYTRVLHASTGSVTFTSIGEADNASIKGSVAATNYREIDEQTGADVAMGCTTSLMGLQFNLIQKAAMMREVPEDGMLSKAQMSAIATAIESVHAQQK
jgi:hypothetical protein